MPRGLYNWTFTDVEKFLKKHNFRLGYTRGSHYYYVGPKARIVQVPFHGSRTLRPRTLNGIIRQSGISKDAWLERSRRKERKEK